MTLPGQVLSLATSALLHAGLLLLPIALVSLACGGDDELRKSAEAAQGEVEKTVQSATDAYNKQDVAGFVSFWTDRGLEEEFGATREEILANPDQFLGGPPRQIRSMENTRIRLDQAATDAEFTLAKSLERERIGLLREDNAWKIAGTQPLGVSIPSGTEEVYVQMDEFLFEFDAGDIQDGNIAFRAYNTGEQAHELVFMSVPEDFDLQAVSALPPGVEVVGGIAPKTPGQEANLVFSETLAAGRYVMLCFLPDTNDPQGTSHVLKGMAAEVIIPPQGGN